MRNFLFISTVVLPCLALSPASAQEKRTFTSSDGKTLEADLVSATDKQATLKRTSDGKEFVLPLDRLSEDDRKYVAGWLAKEAEKVAANAKANSRAARELDLSVEVDRSEKVKVPEGEYLSKDDVLTLYPGDKVHLEFSEFGKPSVVAAVSKPDSTVTFELTNADGVTTLNRTTDMQLTVAMDCENRPLGTEEFGRTHLRPTDKGLAATDAWQGKVWTLKLSNFEVSQKSADEVYNERVSK
ncbi:hypothetical protein OKA04_17635 [Luteolibacter flavescens]|uniref:SLA1 homology domain-containing protein n=1 Tax=Luteolibacter flavescens TaxID=1859460 RepID=A0ABT3FTL1_9BACT|nr:hypothetical protein [Luteolibacter flavescens]MCW1886564.1 hypothetical protein [Luteolibacter flavescens]